MTKPSHDPSVHNEPWLRGGAHDVDQSEEQAQRILDGTRSAEQRVENKVEHTVWDEPALATELAGPRPDGALNYHQWLMDGWARTKAGKSWMITAAIALLAGPWAILGAFISGNIGGLDVGQVGLVYVIVLGPVTEELMKVAAALYIIEKRPFLYLSPVQIIICTAVGGLMFACVENLLYLHVYTRQASAELAHWRWTVCVWLHVGCSIIAGMGLIRIWRATKQQLARPQLSLAYPYLVTAMCVHGAYNFFAVILSLTKYRL